MLEAFKQFKASFQLDDSLICNDEIRLSSIPIGPKKVVVLPPTQRDSGRLDIDKLEDFDWHSQGLVCQFYAYFKRHYNLENDECLLQDEEYANKIFKIHYDYRQRNLT